MADNQFREGTKLMPVRCGCGRAVKASSFYMGNHWAVKCPGCGMGQMFGYRTEEEAVNAWNVAMLGNMRRAFSELKYECFDCKHFDYGICKAELLDDFYATPGNICPKFERR